MAHAYLKGPIRKFPIPPKRVKVAYGCSTVSYATIQKMVSEQFSEVNPEMIDISVDCNEDVWIEVR